MGRGRDALLGTAPLPWRARRVNPLALALRGKVRAGGTRSNICLLHNCAESLPHGGAHVCDGRNLGSGDLGGGARNLYKF